MFAYAVRNDVPGMSQVCRWYMRANLYRSKPAYANICNFLGIFPSVWHFWSDLLLITQGIENTPFYLISCSNPLPHWVALNLTIENGRSKRQHAPLQYLQKIKGMDTVALLKILPFPSDILDPHWKGMCVSVEGGGSSDKRVWNSSIRWYKWYFWLVNWHVLAPVNQWPWIISQMWLRVSSNITNHH